MFVTTLASCYKEAGFFITEKDGYLLVGFQPEVVHIIVKEVWNKHPLAQKEAEAYYTKLVTFGKPYCCRYFRIIAYGGYEAEAQAFELYGLTLSDENYLESLQSGHHVELYPHNEQAYRAIEEGFQNNRIGAVVQATGTGKSYLLARYIATHLNEKIIVIAPNITILEEIREAIGFEVSHVTWRTFQALAINLGKETPLQADHILIDEFHHFGAEVWGEAVQELIEANPTAYVLGTSATPIRPDGMLDTVELYFEGNLFHELTLPEAWFYGILPVPVLVQSAYGMDTQLNRLQKQLDRSYCTHQRRERILKKINTARIDFNGSLGAAALLKQYLPQESQKLLVFCRDLSDLKQMVREVGGWLKESGRTFTTFEIHNNRSEKENKETLECFKAESDLLHVLFSINMLIEGLHVKGVDAALFLRQTESYIVTFQQLGRCLNAGSKRRPVVLDFVNNLSGQSVYNVLYTGLERLSREHHPKGFEGVKFQVTGFLSDIRRQVEDILAELEPWLIMYERLEEYYAREQDWPSVTEGKLGLWCNTQRRAYRQGKLSPERIEALNALRFEWELLDSQWSKSYQQLKEFITTNNRQPKRADGTLYIWCTTQRSARRSGKLTKERIRRLDEIGFVWNLDVDLEWMKRYTELQSYLIEHNRFPVSGENRLGEWCSTQRKMKRQGRLSEERTMLLEKLNFIWSNDQLWQERYEEVLAFHQQNDRWPNSREGVLGNWCMVQRQAWRKGILLKERQQSLEAYNFPF